MAAQTREGSSTNKDQQLKDAAEKSARSVFGMHYTYILLCRLRTQICIKFFPQKLANVTREY